MLTGHLNVALIPGVNLLSGNGYRDLDNFSSAWRKSVSSAMSSPLIRDSNVGFTWDLITKRKTLAHNWKTLQNCSCVVVNFLCCFWPTCLRASVDKRFVVTSPHLHTHRGIPLMTSSYNLYVYLIRRITEKGRQRGFKVPIMLWIMPFECTNHNAQTWCT